MTTRQRNVTLAAISMSQSTRVESHLHTCDSANFHGDADAVGVAETIFVLVPDMVEEGIEAVVPMPPPLVAFPVFPETLQ
jgi:hypothetical protein